MSGREWRMGTGGRYEETGDKNAGGAVGRSHRAELWDAEAWINLERESERGMREWGIRSHEDARRVAEEWLDRRAKADMGGEA